jgi:hypothetical protein
MEVNKLLTEIQSRISTAMTDCKFYVIIFTEVLEHFNFHPLKIQERLISSLNSGGTLILTTPDVGTDAWGRV